MPSFSGTSKLGVIPPAAAWAVIPSYFILKFEYCNNGIHIVGPHLPSCVDFPTETAMERDHGVGISLLFEHLPYVWLLLQHHT